MTKILAALLWPVGIALIIGAGALLARRGRAAVPATSGTRQRGASAQPGRHGSAASAREWDLRVVAMNAARLVAVVVVGAVAIYGLMAALGTLVVHTGPSIDKPILSWTMTHRMSSWAHVMDRLTKLGNTWTTWGACIAAAVCIAATYRRNRWLAPVAFAAAIVIDHYLTLSIRHTFHRIGPPGSPGGTFPSGGVDRVILFYGLIAYLLWREFSGRRRAAAWAGTAVAALAFNEAYSRWYLTLHWTTDILSGLLYGCLQLVLIITAVRLVVGPVDVPAGAPAAVALRPADVPDGAPAAAAQHPAPATAPAGGTQLE
jgi:membrane-associated phospholipid phosphatase